MVDRGFAIGTAHLVSNAVKSFMKANGLLFPLYSRDLPRRTVQGSRVVRLDEIRELWDVVGNELKLRNRALLMVLKDTGLRVSDMCSLTCEMYHGARVVETEKGVFRVFRPYVTVKTATTAYIHIGPESCEAVDLYLKDRVKGPLFLGRTGKPMTKTALTMLIHRTASRLVEMDMSGVSAHSFRKTHRTLLEAHIPQSYVLKLQGKATDPYIHPEQTGELTEAYIKHYDAITVFREEVEIEQLRKQVDTQSRERDDINRRLRDAEDYIRVQRMKEALEKKS